MRIISKSKLLLPALCCIAMTVAGAREEAPGAAPQQSTTPPPVPSEPVNTAPVDQVTPGPLEDMIRTAGSDRVFFAFDSSALSADARETLTRQANWLRTYPAVSVRVEGHADERGTREYNLALGSRRANAVKNYLVALGVPSGRVDTISYGKERPAVLGSGPSVWSKNRRGVTTISSVSN